jgi:hypothetical protein
MTPVNIKKPKTDSGSSLAPKYSNHASDSEHDSEKSPGSGKKKNPPLVFDMLKKIPLPNNSAYKIDIVVDWIRTFLKHNKYEPGDYISSWNLTGVDPVLLQPLVIAVKDETTDKWKIKDKLKMVLKNWPLQ